MNATEYSDSRSEKSARGTLFTAIQRSLGRNNIVIVDSLNYIKGFRYQMYCAAREMKVRVCTVCIFLVFLYFGFSPDAPIVLCMVC